MNWIVNEYYPDGEFIRSITYCSTELEALRKANELNISGIDGCLYQAHEVFEHEQETKPER